MFVAKTFTEIVSNIFYPCKCKGKLDPERVYTKGQKVYINSVVSIRNVSKAYIYYA